MERFAPQSLEKFAGSMVLVEKSVTHDARSARRFRILGTPTFVLLDRAGSELTRFYYEPTPERLEARIAPFAGTAGR